jgi:hypothetical protein
LSLGLVVTLALSVAACGGDGSEARPTTRSVTVSVSKSPSPDEVVALFLINPLNAELSPESRGRVSIARLRSRYASFAGAKVLVSQRITDEFGVVAVRKGTRAAAFALRLVGERWLIELGGPLTIEPLGPRPGAREAVVAQIGAELHDVRGSVTAVMWLDRQALDPKIYAGASRATVYASFDPPVDRGRHVAVVFAADLHEASATAWTFTVAK